MDKIILFFIKWGKISVLDFCLFVWVVGGIVGVVCMMCVFGGIVLFDLLLYINFLKFVVKLIKLN